MHQKSKNRTDWTTQWEEYCVYQLFLFNFFMYRNIFYLWIPYRSSSLYSAVSGWMTVCLSGNVPKFKGCSGRLESLGKPQGGLVVKGSYKLLLNFLQMLILRVANRPRPPHSFYLRRNAVRKGTNSGNLSSSFCYGPKPAIWGWFLIWVIFNMFSEHSKNGNW